MKPDQNLNQNQDHLQRLVNIALYSGNSINEFLDNVLEEALALSSSKLGFINFYDEKKKKFKVFSWSKQAMEQCQIIDKPFTNYLANTGIWGEVVRQRGPIIINDYQASHPAKKGYPKGHVHLFNFMSVPVISSSGSIVAVAGVSNKEGGYTRTDMLELTLLMETAWKIVERIHAEQELTAAHDRMAAILDNNDAFIYIADLKTHEILFLNRYARNIYGDGVGKKCWEVIQQGQTGPCPFCTNHKLLDDDGRPTGVYAWEFQNTRNGKWYLCRDNALRWTDGRMVRLEIATDITAQKEAEQLLLEREKEFRAVFELASVGIVQVDPRNGQMLRYNEKYREITGYSHEELRVINFPQLTHPEDRQDDWEVFSRAARGETPHYTNEKRYIRKDGSIIWVRLNASFIRDETGRPVRTVAVCEDITDRKKAEETLRKSEASVRRKLAGIISPRGNLGDLELADIIDVEAIQSLMNDFCSLTRIGIGIVDLQGKVLVATGWQEICTRFHRVHPETARHCFESDTELTQNMSPGSYKLYRCKNNMWDIATPFIIGGRHVGNLFLGQFFFDDEELDYDYFRSQARKYGFNENDYLHALEQVPRFSRTTIPMAMDFYNKFANMISRLSYSNLELARLLAERDSMIKKLQKAEGKLADYTLELEQLYQQLDTELEKAQRVHERILPAELPRLTGISLAAHYQPAQRLGGDFYDLIPKGNKVFIYLSDVSGHGLDGAMLSVFVKHTIKSYISFKPTGELAPAAILRYLTEQFSRENYPEEYFICLFIAVLDLDSLEMTYCGAGFHDTPLVRLGSGKKLVLTGEGVVISPAVPREMRIYQEKSIVLGPGATIFFNTDGLTEEERSGVFYSERLPTVFYANAHLNPGLIVRAVLDDFRQFNNGSQGDDDITFLVMQTGQT